MFVNCKAGWLSSVTENPPSHEKSDDHGIALYRVVGAGSRLHRRQPVTRIGPDFQFGRF